MIVQEELKKLIDSLVDHDLAAISIDGNEIFVHLIQDGSKLSLAAQLWQGSNYIPASIRSGVQATLSPLNGGPFAPTLIINEQLFQIYLYYVEPIEELSHHQLAAILQEFSLVTSYWRHYLDDQDKRDRIFIRIR